MTEREREREREREKFILKYNKLVTLTINIE